MTCDIIEEENGIELPFGHTLPVSLSITWQYPYTLESATRTPEEASVLAFAELDRELSALSDDLQLLRKNIKTTLTDDGLILECTIECIENIAVQSEFEIIE